MSQNNNHRGKMTVKEAGRKGGLETSRRHGHQFFHDIGVKGGQRVRELVKNGKKVEKLGPKDPSKLT